MEINMNTKLKNPKLYTFKNYRKFLKAYYEFKKATAEKYSYQVMATLAGMKSNSYIIDIIGNRKDLSPHTAFKIGDSMGFSHKQMDYFISMVFHNDCTNPVEQKYQARKMRLAKR